MTETSISLLSILVGIVAALLFAKLKPIYSLGFAGNCIVGVFGSILFIKVFGRLLNLAPDAVVLENGIHLLKLTANLLLSALGGLLGLYIAHRLTKN